MQKLKNRLQRIAIVRTALPVLKLDTYNIQEIGFAKGLLEMGISTDIYSSFDGVNAQKVLLQDERGCIRILPLGKGIRIIAGISFYPELFFHLKNGDYDLIQVNSHAELMTPLILRMLSGKTRLAFLEGLYQDYKSWKGVFQKIFDFVFKNWIVVGANFHLAKTETAKEYLEVRGYRKVNVLPVGLDFSAFGEKELHWEFEDDLNIFCSNHQKIVTYIGRIEDRRQPIFLLKLLILLNNHCDVGLVVVGSGPLENEFKCFISDNGLESKVFWKKCIPNQATSVVYSRTNLFILPTKYEIYGMVVLEALFHGVPVVSSAEAGPVSILKNKILGSCVKDWSIQNWNEIVIEYLDVGNDVTQTINANIRKNYVLDNYSWSRIAECFVNQVLIEG